MNHQETYSPLSNDLVRSNIAPTASESNHIKNLISQGDRDLTRLEVEIARTTNKAVVDSLVNQRHELHVKVDAYKAVLAPARRLPPEILGEILLHCIEDGVPIVPSARQPPLLFCQICSFWRNVALEQSALWRNIRIFLNARNEAQRYKMLRIWLDRAKSLPLDIDIRGSSGVSTIPTSILLPYLPTTRSLSLDLPSNILVSFLASEIPTISMPLMEEMDLAASPAIEFSSPILGALSIFQDTPRLRSLNISSSERHILEIPGLQVSYSKIVHLSIDDVYLPDNVAAVLFQQLVNLEELELEVRSWDRETVSDSFFPIVIPRLRSLDLTVDMPDDLNHIFKMLTLPLLDDLSISLYECLFVDLPEFYKLQMRSSFNLSQLSLCYVSFRPGDFETLLRANPSLTDLRILDAYWSLDHDIRVLEYSPEDTNPILPQLQDLLIHKTFMNDDKLAGMIASRWWPDTDTECTPSASTSRIARLKSVSICADEDDESSGDITSPGALEVLDKCRREGLELTIMKRGGVDLFS